jgi:antitoxin CptB
MGLTDNVCRVYDTQPMTEPEHDARRRRLLFRSTHRGTFENDLMIGGFVRANLATFSDDDLDAMEAVLELPDVDLADWLTGRREIPAEDATPMLLRIRESLRR